MTGVQTCALPICQAAGLISIHEPGRCLAVVDESGKLLGVVSPWDLLRVHLRPDEDRSEAPRPPAARRLLA